MKKIKVLELFSGIGATRKALQNAKIPHEIVAISEIDNFALKSYGLLYGEYNNLGDISKINTSEIPDVDLITYGFPCQDLSIAGKQLGADENSGTRSSLLWQVARIIKDKKPKYLLMENVKNLIGPTHKKNFLKFLDFLEDLGYDNNWKILNAKDYNLPQNRERVFVVSSLKGLDNFQFPEPIERTYNLNDFLEESVDSKYFMDDKPYIPRSNPSKGASGLIHIGDLDMKANQSIKRVYDPKGICPTLTTMTGGHRQPKILINNRVRKLTPRECWRVMGFEDEDFNKVKNELSNTQLYKQIGNSICVPCLEEIFKNLLIE